MWFYCKTLSAKYILESYRTIKLELEKNYSPRFIFPSSYFAASLSPFIS